jgi:nucleotide-binding universal stress UspA family protein
MSDVALPGHLLVPFDFSDASHRALRHAAALARKLDARLSVLHVGPPTTMFLSPFPDLAGFQMDSWTNARAQREDIALTRLEAATADDCGELTPTLMYVEAEVPTAVAEAVAEHGVDLVVIGSRGPKGGPLWRSVAERILAESEFPVLILR